MKILYTDFWLKHARRKVSYQYKIGHKVRNTSFLTYYLQTEANFSFNHQTQRQINTVTGVCNRKLKLKIIKCTDVN